MNSSKRYIFRAVVIVGLGLAFSFILSCIAGWIQENIHQSYNVMGVTLPDWFYVALVINALFYVVGAYQIIMMIFNLALESVVIKNSQDSIEQIDKDSFDGIDVIQPNDYNSQVYDPSLALMK